MLPSQVHENNQNIIFEATGVWPRVVRSDPSHA